MYIYKNESTHINTYINAYSHTHTYNNKYTNIGLVTNCMKNKDFYEGIRALLIEKDNNASWNPPTLGECTDEYIDSYFQYEDVMDRLEK